MSKRCPLIVATLVGSLSLGLSQARADFCLNAVFNGTDGVFFRFQNKYPTKADKITKLNGKILFVEGTTVTYRGPAYGQILGLPEGDAGNSLGISFAVRSVPPPGAGSPVYAVGQASIVLDDNDKMSGAGTVVLETTHRFVTADIVDCATEPS